MSSDISYIIKAIDNFSETFKKFNADIGKVNSGINQSSGQFTKLDLISTKTLKDASGNVINTNKQFRDFNGNINTVTQSFQKAEARASGFGLSLKNMAAGFGLYLGLNEIRNFGIGIFETRKMLDGLEASLSAILPRFDKTKSGTTLAAEEMEYLKRATDKLGVSIKDILPAYVQLMSNSSFGLKETRGVFEAFAGYGRLNALSAEQQKSMMFAIQQMMGKGKVQAQEYNLQLKPVMPGAADMFNKALARVTAGTKDAGKSIERLMEEGRVGAGILLEVSKIIQEDYGEAIIKKSHTLGGELDRNKNAFFDLQTTISTMFKPAMIDSILAINGFLKSIGSVFKAMNDQTAFKKLNSDAQALVTTLQVVSGFLGGMVDSIKFIGEGFGILTGTARNVVSAGTIATYAAVNNKPEERAIASGAMSQLWENTKQLWVGEQQPQKVEIQVNFDNMPQGAKAEVKTPPSGKNVKVGNQTSYAGGR